MSLPALNQEELKFIQEAAEFLDNPGFAIRVMNLVGKPIEELQKKLPDAVREKIGAAVQKFLETSLAAAIKTVPQSKPSPPEWQDAITGCRQSGWYHTATVSFTGAVGGMLGIISLPVELPISATLMLRGISDVAARWGMDLNDPQVQLQCLYVATLGSTETLADDDLDSAYLTSRLAFEQVMRSASTYMAKKSVSEVLKALDSGTAPALLRLISRVARTFELTLTEKFLAESIPVVGAVGGATINALFCDYFMEAARFHFGLLYLEQKHGRKGIEKTFKGAHRVNEPAGA